MSSIYNLEPQPTASAIIHTTLGEISIELFAKQTPLACRNFLQLATDGYYSDTVFHRLVPDFILQAGDPTGTGNGGESIYDGGAFSGDLDPWPMDQRQGKNAGPQGINFKDEFHSRLKFNRRGLLAMANEGKPDTNGSQFFFTLDKTEELNGKNTLFGRVVGDTIYNLTKIGESEVDPLTERPVYTVSIKRIEVLVNPFQDMKKRTRVASQLQSNTSQDKDSKKKQKRKGGKQLLSFDDEEADSDMPVFKKKKFDTRVVAAEEQEDNEQVERSVHKKKTHLAKPKPSVQQLQQEDETNEKENETIEGHNSSLRERTKKQESAKTENPLSESSPEREPPPKSALQKANEEIASLKASMRRTVQIPEALPEKKKSALEQMIFESSAMAKKRKPKGLNASAADDQATLDILKAFQSKLDKTPMGKEVEHSLPVNGNAGTHQTDSDEGQVCDLHFVPNCLSCTAWDQQEKGDSDDEGWMSHSLSFAADRLGKDLSNRRKAVEELVVIDPREKVRTMKEEKRSEKDARQGNSGRAWDQARDQARNAQIAKAASLAGRGAK